jgi:hypothetical protein
MPLHNTFCCQTGVNQLCLQLKSRLATTYSMILVLERKKRKDNPNPKLKRRASWIRG